MKLWTWQKKGFSLIDSVKPVDSRIHSDYYNEHEEQFEKLWDRLGTTQFLWCYTEKEDAFSQVSEGEYVDHVPWELAVDSIFQNICTTAWNLILDAGRCSPPSKRETWKREYPDNFRKKIEDWHRFWEKKTTKELWDTLFMPKEIITPCSTVLVRYPLETDAEAIGDIPDKRSGTAGQFRRRFA